MKKFAKTIAAAALAVSALGLGAGIGSAAPGDHYVKPVNKAICKSFAGTNNQALINFNKAAAELAEQC